MGFSSAFKGLKKDPSVAHGLLYTHIADRSNGKATA